MPRKTVFSTIILLLVILSNHALPTPIINGGFETGDDTGWEPPDWSYDIPNHPGESFYGCFVTDFAHSGNYSRLLHHDRLGSYRRDTFYQNIDVSDGRTILSFWLNIDIHSYFGPIIEPPFYSLEPPPAYAGVTIADPQTTHTIKHLVSFGGRNFMGHYTTYGWRHYEFDLANYTTQQELRLTFWLETGSCAANLYQRLYVDDVTLTPEPAGLALLAAGVMALRKRRKSKRTP